MNDIIVSVVIPVYNAEKYLDKCIKSILDQTLKNIELILIDDGSKDKSASICNRYASKDLRVKVIHKINAGVSVARNTGLQYATGKWVMFVDADDWVDTNTLEYILEKSDDNCDCIIFDTAFEYSNRSELLTTYDTSKVFEAKKDFEYIFRKMLYPHYMGLKNSASTLVGPCSKLYLNKLLKENPNIKFPDNVKISEDTIFNYEYFQHCKKISYVQNTFYHYRQQEGSVSKTYKAGDSSPFEPYNCYMVQKMKKNKEYLKYFYAGVIQQIRLTLSWTALHVDNKNSLRNKLKNIKKICQNKYVIMAIKNLDKDFLKVTLTKEHKIVNWICKYHQYWIFMFINEVRKFKNKIIKAR